MPTITVIVTLYSLFVAFASRVSVDGLKNPILSFFDVQTQFILHHKSFFVFVAIVLSILFLFFNRKRASRLFGLYFKFVLKIIFVSVLGSTVAFLLLFFIAFAELNVLSVLTYVYPKALGVETDSQKIIENIKRSAIAPTVLVGREEKLLLPTIAQAQSGKDSFYGSRVLPTLSSYILVPMKKTNVGVLMVGDTLIVDDIGSTDFQLLSPVVSYSFINSYFRNRSIKHYPKVALMDKDEYQAYRELDFDKKLQLFDELIAKINEDSAALEDAIPQKQEELAQKEQQLKDAKTQREKDYIKCVNTGYYESGTFYKTYTKEECQEQMGKQDELITQLENESKDLESSLEKDLKTKDDYGEYLKYYESQKILTKEESGYVSYEFAAFVPSDEIKVSLTLQNGQLALADYFELMIHEYMHYATFNEDGKALTSSFFMEGLTEYFARNIIKQSLGVDTNIGYPANVKILQQMTKRIAERDLADVYFDNDQEGLEKLLDRAYGEGFYDNNIITLETLFYTSDKAKILELANNVMNEIGGESLTESDLQTTYSTFE